MLQQKLEKGLGQILGFVRRVSFLSQVSVDGRPIALAHGLEGDVVLGSLLIAGGEDLAPNGGGEPDGGTFRCLMVMSGPVHKDRTDCRLPVSDV